MYCYPQSPNIPTSFPASSHQYPCLLPDEHVPPAAVYYRGWRKKMTTFMPMSVYTAAHQTHRQYNNRCRLRWRLLYILTDTDVCPNAPIYHWRLIAHHRPLHVPPLFHPSPNFTPHRFSCRHCKQRGSVINVSAIRPAKLRPLLLTHQDPPKTMFTAGH